MNAFSPLRLSRTTAPERSRSVLPRLRSALLGVPAAIAIVVSGMQAAPAFAANGPTISSATFSGAGTVTTGGTLYAKSGTALTLTVTTSTDAGCVIVTTGAGGSGRTLGIKTTATSSTGTGKTWAFPITAASGNDGAQGLTVGTSGGANSNNNSCTGPGTTTSASYSVDNTGPSISSALSGTKGTAPWFKGDVTVNWTATDAGAGVVAQPFKTDTVATDGTTTLTAPAQKDLLGNVSSAGGSVTVYRDATKPTITASEGPVVYGQPVTVTFTCTDETSGISACAAGTSASSVSSAGQTSANGTTTNTVTVSGNGTVYGQATDAAGNGTTTSFEVKNVDTTAPLLSGAPTTDPNSDHWYQGDVAVHWTASDPESGIPTPPADTTITGEGRGLTSSQTVQNGAGISTTATSSPAVNIDRTAPTTGISGGSNMWTSGNVTLTLTPSDNLSDVASTTYTVDGGSAQSGTSIALTTEGDHTISYFSTDKAGNVEATKTAEVKIDKTAPTIKHVFTSPSGYTDGAWTNQNVTVTFDCADQGGSGVASCTAPVTTSTEGASQSVVGTVRDGAGNSATDTATVSIDTTKPTITATANGTKNDAGWYNQDVIVSYSANDALSGVTSTPKNDVLGEGADQTASATVTDAAGNSASAGVSGINVDKTAPVLSADYSTGWHIGDVKVTWSCTDPKLADGADGSGVATGPSDDTVTGEGDNLTSTATCTDTAGNTATKTVSGIKIDRTAPTTTASVPKPNGAGWYGTAVTVTLDATDNLSGIAATYYSVDGGDPQTYSGPFSYTTEGTHRISFWSEDGAGNLELAGAPITLQIDTTAPTTTIVNPISPDSGWFVASGIPFAFGADDSSSADSVSGVAATYYTIDDGATQTYGKPFTDNLSDGQHTVHYWSVDAAGNEEAHHSKPVNVDTTPPTITAGQTPAANGFGWNNSPVTVHFDCADATGSGLQTGVAGCSPDATLSNEGSGQSATGEAFDVAGNHASATYGPVNIDTTKPTLAGQLPDANAAGWYRGDVTVKWVGNDAGSGIDPATQPAPSTITGEGSNLGAGPVTISDQAGNTSDDASVSGIRIDRTGPVVTGGPTTRPNALGWYTSAVTVDFHCDDPKLADGTSGSGVADCPTSALLSGDGAGQSVTSATATDKAGNTGAGTTVSGIDIDGTAPTTTATTACTDLTGHGWCTGSTAEVHLSAQDQPGLSGVKEIHYSVDGGAEQVIAGDAATAPVSLTGTGAGTVRYWAVDNADNAETPKSVSLKWDNIAPTVTHTLSPAANAAGWSSADTVVTFSAQDDASGSGVDSSTLTAPVTVSSETAGRMITGSAKDAAGNLGTDSATVKLDKTLPTITAITSGTRGAGGWYIGPVTVTFSCTDPAGANGATGSGVATCPDPVTLTANGAGQSAGGMTTDQAGNSASTTVTGIDIDQEKPTITKVNVDGGAYQLGSVPAPTCTATDSVSGLASCTVTVTGGNSAGVGTLTYTATATDKAGNTSTATGTYKVAYNWTGFLQPINDTAHQTGISISVFKAGSTVPVKFQLKNAAGTVMKAAVAPEWLTPVVGTAMSVPVNDTATAASVDSGSAFTYDSASGQYQYNWKTPSSGSGHWYNVGVKLDDGATQYVTIGLK